MIYELRTYTLSPGTQPEYLRLNRDVGRKIRGDKYGKLEGAWTTEFGTLNQYVHLWSYPDLNERERLRQALAKDAAWTKEYVPQIRPLILTQENKILASVESVPLTGPLGGGRHVYELRLMNMGPQHPSAHGVFRAILTLEGETIVAVDAVIGYLHRCHEKLGETLTYVQYPSIASKTDYVAAMTSELAYVLAAEKIGQIEVPKRAQYLRVIAAELQRIASHCLWLGTWCMDMGGALGGGATLFLYCFRERETLLDRVAPLTGPRPLAGFHQVGGTRYDLPAGWAERCRSTVDLIEKRIDEYEAMLEGNAFFLARTRGVGVISPAL